MSITLTVTTCKRLGCFIKTINCLKKFCQDFDTISRIIIVDDSSSEHDREYMKNMLPNCELVTHDNKSHAKSLNIIREMIDTEYILMFEDDWECTQNFKITELLQCMRDIGLQYLNFTNGFQKKIIGNFQGLNITQSCFDLKKLDVYCSPIYTDWINSKTYLRKLLEKIEIENDEYTFHWPCYGLQPSIVSSVLFKKYPFDETEKSSFMELSYGINHVIDGNIKYFGGLNLGIKHIETVSSYVLNDQHRWWDTINNLPTIVTFYLDIGRNDRPQEHYLESFKKILEIPNPKVVYWDLDHLDLLPTVGTNVKIVPINKRFEKYKDVLKIVSTEKWKSPGPHLISKNGDEYMARYICTTFLKHTCLQEVADENPFKTKEFYWVDCGIHSSFQIQKQLKVDYLNVNGLFVTTFPHYPDYDVHGLSTEYINQKVGEYKKYVTRASFFGGSLEHIQKVGLLFKDIVDDSIQNGYVGTEESYYTILTHNYPELFNVYKLPTGDIGYFFSNCN